MNNNITIIIPTYNRPDALDICLNSIFYTDKLENIDVIVYIDGNLNLFTEIIEKYKNIVKFIKNEKNYGLATAINVSVYNTDSKYLLIINDDNVFPVNFDKKLNEIIRDYDLNEYCITVNQIENKPSIYPNINITDCGNINNFDYDKFNDCNKKLSTSQLFNYGGGLFPFLITKKNYMIVNGFDIAYNSPYIMDWDFFLKLELNNIRMKLSKHFHLYHFGSLSTKNNDDENVVKMMNNKEYLGMQYFKYKWHTLPRLGENNTKIDDFLKKMYF